jgi:hypothetical protein
MQVGSLSAKRYIKKVLVRSVPLTLLVGIGIVSFSSDAGSSTVNGSVVVPPAEASSLLSIAGIAVVVLALFGFMAIVGLFIIIVVANRADPDPSGRRPQSVYYFAVSFVTLVGTILGSVVVFVSLIQLIGHHSSGIGDATARAVVLGGLIALASGILLRAHIRRGVGLVGSETTSPSRRVAQSYVSAVAFLSMLTLLVVSILVVYLLFVLIGPGVFGSFGGRTAAWRDLLDALYVGAVTAFVLRAHQNLVSPGLRLFGAPRMPPWSSATASPPPAP